MRIVHQSRAAIAALAMLAAADAQAEGTWRAVEFTTDPRESSGLIMLRDGRALVVGGHVKDGSRELIGTAEIYDPKTESWTLTGPLVQPRQGVGALAPLNGDRVLLAGEHDTKTGCELYDPAIGKWRRTGSLVVGRGNHTTTTLADGRVLVTGGIDWSAEPPTVLASAEIYDPATETWSGSGSMATPRHIHRAVRLDDDRVLILGGNATEPPVSRGLAEVELFDPATGSWRATAPMKEPRQAPAVATLRDGRVLVAGGVAGAGQKRVSLPSAEIFDPKTETWASTGEMTRDRCQFTLTVLKDGRVLAVGGASRPIEAAYFSAEIYDPATGAWTSAGEMATKRYNHRAELLGNGDVLVVGGYNRAQRQLHAVEIFTP